MKLTSTAFAHGGIIPSRYTCEGANVVPPLTIEEVPLEAKSLAIIMEDPDVPVSIRGDGLWVHWLMFNIPTQTHLITDSHLPGGVSGFTTFGHMRYGGPCPPDREHRYFFRLYALDRLLDLSTGAAKKQLDKAIQGHILEEAVLMGRYEKGKGY